MAAAQHGVAPTADIREKHQQLALKNQQRRSGWRAKSGQTSWHKRC